MDDYDLESCLGCVRSRKELSVLAPFVEHAKARMEVQEDASTAVFPSRCYLCVRMEVSFMASGVYLG